MTFNIPVLYIALVILLFLLILAAIMIWRLVKAVSIRASEKGFLDAPLSLKKPKRTVLIHVLRNIFAIIRRL